MTFRMDNPAENVRMKFPGAVPWPRPLHSFPVYPGQHLHSVGLSQTLVIDCFVTFRILFRAPISCLKFVHIKVVLGAMNVSGFDKHVPGVQQQSRLPQPHPSDFSSHPSPGKHCSDYRFHNPAIFQDVILRGSLLGLASTSEQYIVKIHQHHSAAGVLIPSR